MRGFWLGVSALKIAIAHGEAKRICYRTVEPDYRVEVSHRLKDEFDNGKEYYALQGRNIVLPESPAFRPSEEQLTWHNENVYRA
jgi:predicted restriction endonuclease